MQSGSTPSVDDKFKDIEPPSISDMEIQLQKLVEQGVISPEDAQTVMLEQSQMNGITLDPRLKEQQMASLSALDEIANGGMTAMDQANLSRISNEENSAAKGKRDAILQSAQMRGAGGSGVELMDQMLNEQSSATRKSQRDLDVAGLAQQRALDAIMQQGTLAGNIANQDFGQQSSVAQANDAISKFNAQNSQNQINSNVANRNAAQAANLQAKQNIANANVGQNNDQQKYNKNLIQQDFNNKMAKAGGSANVAQANAQAQGQNSQNAANANNQLVGIGAGLAGSYLGGPVGGVAAKKVVDGKIDGGHIEGDQIGFDSVQTPTEPGELVVRRDEVPEFLKKVHTDEDGNFDAAAFLDSYTGGKYNYSKKRMK